jgi:hypothetical protein
MKTLKKLKWDHNGESLVEVLGYKNLDELTKDAEEASNNGDISLLAAAALCKTAFESPFVRYAARLIYPDRSDKVSYFCEILYNLVVEDFNSESPTIQDKIPLLYTLSNEDLPVEEMLKELIELIDEKAKEEEKEQQ